MGCLGSCYSILPTSAFKSTRCRDPTGGKFRNDNIARDSPSGKHKSRLRGVSQQIPNTCYNLVPREVLPDGDQLFPLGDHLLPTTIEKIGKESMFIFLTY